MALYLVDWFQASEMMFSVQIKKLYSVLLHFQDESDVVFRATTGKWRAVVVEISRMHKTGRPVLVGTTSVEQSDSLSEQLQEVAIPHEVHFFFSEKRAVDDQIDQFSGRKAI